MGAPGRVKGEGWVGVGRIRIKVRCGVRVVRVGGWG